MKYFLLLLILTFLVEFTFSQNNSDSIIIIEDVYAPKGYITGRKATFPNGRILSYEPKFRLALSPNKKLLGVLEAKVNDSITNVIIYNNEGNQLNKHIINYHHKEDSLLQLEKERQNKLRTLALSFLCLSNDGRFAVYFPSPLCYKFFNNKGECIKQYSKKKFNNYYASCSFGIYDNKFIIFYIKQNTSFPKPIFEACIFDENYIIEKDFTLVDFPIPFKIIDIKLFSNFIEFVLKTKNIERENLKFNFEGVRQ